MPLEIIRDDISRLSTDAIVHTTNTNLIRGRGSSEAIFKSAGFKLEEALQEIGHCEVGEAVITPGFNLASKYIIHTVGPVWIDGLHNESKVLEACYKGCLALALKLELKSIAFPLISAGTYGYPKDEALRIATSTIQSFLLKHEMKVYLVVFDKQVYQLSTQLFDSVKQYVDDHYVEIRGSRQRINSEETNFRTYKKISYESSTSIDDILLELDSSFSETLLKLIDQKDLRDVDVYKRANISKAHFSKIRSHKDYHPTKTTVLAFCISLKLNLSETRDLLEKAGFSLSNSSKCDIIVRYFIENKRYDIFEVNEVLFEYDQQLLGSNTI